MNAFLTSATEGLNVFIHVVKVVVNLLHLKQFLIRFVNITVNKHSYSYYDKDNNNKLDLKKLTIKKDDTGGDMENTSNLNEDHYLKKHFLTQWGFVLSALKINFFWSYLQTEPSEKLLLGKSNGPRRRGYTQSVFSTHISFMFL